MPETAVIGYPHDIKGEGACPPRTLLALGPGLLYEKQTRWAGARAFLWVRLLVHVSQVEILGEEAEQAQVLEKSQDSEMSWFCRPLRTLTHKQL